MLQWTDACGSYKCVCHTKSEIEAADEDDLRLMDISDSVVPVEFGPSGIRAQFRPAPPVWSWT